VKIGAEFAGAGECSFTVWAPFAKAVSLQLVRPERRVISMEPLARGYWRAAVAGVSEETSYVYDLGEGTERPDPASHLQPEGVHGPSAIVDHTIFRWEDGLFRGIPLRDMVLYELHVGTFTPEGTFDAVIPRLDELLETGINAVEIMPVAQFPGDRNWGYDGAYLFAVQNSYGGPGGLKRLVNECHKRGMAVVLDVVYNHMGPEGNYIENYGPYFTDKYRTPWGKAVNFDDEYSSEVRNFFIENALHWFGNYHFDGIRLDAIHGIADMSATPFLRQLAERVREFSRREGKRCHLIAESDLNDSRVIRPAESGGFGLDAQWCDDFHHALHAVLTGEREGYYQDFGRVEHLVKSIRGGYVYSGGYSEFRKRDHGNRSNDRPADQFVIFSQNHDQVGNRMLGERLSSLVSFEELKLAAGVVLLSPSVPLLFMGEEYGEEAPFLYFVSHGDPDLVEAVRKGRRAEFGSFSWKEDPPDPQATATFLKSKIQWGKRVGGRHKVLLDLYRKLLRLRKESAAITDPDRDNLDVCGAEGENLLFLRRWKDDCHLSCVFNFNRSDVAFNVSLPAGRWKKLVDSADTVWNGPGALLPETIVFGDRVTSRRTSFAVYRWEDAG